MTRLMIVVGSVRPGRVGLPVANWVRGRVEADGRFELDWADLAAINLPLMDEPAHPKMRKYTKPHTIAWSERVDAADAFIFVVPEYNYSFAPSVKNALDYLHSEWSYKPAGLVSYGGVSAGSRGVAALRPVFSALGVVSATPAVEINFPRNQFEGEVFVARESQDATLSNLLGELEALSKALSPVRRGSSQ